MIASMFDCGNCAQQPAPHLKLAINGHPVIAMMTSSYSKLVAGGRTAPVLDYSK